ncbi:hypothetical protein Bbelb_136740 [Branchiostoma belcheri]|nr:hypothetical protein Bbelb_136740 [Branchiostoma belcheri]
MAEWCWDWEISVRILGEGSCLHHLPISWSSLLILAFPARLDPWTMADAVGSSNPVVDAKVDGIDRNRSNRAINPNSEDPVPSDLIGWRNRKPEQFSSLIQSEQEQYKGDYQLHLG